MTLMGFPNAVFLALQHLLHCSLDLPSFDTPLIPDTTRTFGSAQTIPLPEGHFGGACGQSITRPGR